MPAAFLVVAFFALAFFAVAFLAAAFGAEVFTLACESDFFSGRSSSALVFATIFFLPAFKFKFVRYLRSSESVIVIWLERLLIGKPRPCALARKRFIVKPSSTNASTTQSSEASRRFGLDCFAFATADAIKS